MSQVINGIKYSAKALATNPVYFELKEISNGKLAYLETNESSVVLNADSPAIVNSTALTPSTFTLPEINPEMEGKTYNIIKTGETGTDTEVTLISPVVIGAAPGVISGVNVLYFSYINYLDGFPATDLVWGETTPGGLNPEIRLGIKNNSANPIRVSITASGNLTNNSFLESGSISFVTRGADNEVVDIVQTFAPLGPKPSPISPATTVPFTLTDLEFILPAGGYFNATRTIGDIRAQSNSFSITQLRSTPLTIETAGDETINGLSSLTLVDRYDSTKILTGKDNYYVL